MDKTTVMILGGFGLALLVMAVLTKNYLSLITFAVGAGVGVWMARPRA